MLDGGPVDGFCCCTVARAWRLVAHEVCRSVWLGPVLMLPMAMKVPALYCLVFERCYSLKGDCWCLCVSCSCASDINIITRSLCTCKQVAAPRSLTALHRTHHTAPPEHHTAHHRTQRQPLVDSQHLTAHITQHLRAHSPSRASHSS